MPLKLTALPDGKIQIEGGGTIPRDWAQFAENCPESHIAMLLNALGWDGTIPEPVRVEKWPGSWTLIHMGYSPDGDMPDWIVDNDRNIVAACFSKAHADAILALQSRLLAAEKVVEAVKGGNTPMSFVQSIEAKRNIDLALAAYDAEVGGK